MTPPARPDPVAAPERPTKSVRMSPELLDLLSEGGWEFGDPGPDGFYSPTIRSGYVLVNADMLAAALHQAMCDVSHHDQWSVCKNQRRYELIAASALAALKGPAR